MYTVLKQLMKDKMDRGLDAQNKNVTVFCATKVKQSSYRLHVVSYNHGAPCLYKFKYAL